jgi:hypothetical protein
MDSATLKRVLRTFSDNPDDVVVSNSELIVELQEKVVVATVRKESGRLMIMEDENELLAEKWVAGRLGHLPQLADRILTWIPETANFIVPSGALLADLESSPSETECVVEDALECTLTRLETQPAFSSSVLYLTSHAGEGKTTLVNQMARLQAEKYKNRRTDWLLVPVTLGGRPFLRFDDIIVGTLANRFRFSYLYYESFLELVKLGFIVPAFDGFEEMLIESSTGEAISALSSLLGGLDSMGNVLISARRAYFEYKDLDAQARLFDSRERGSATFARLRLDRWDRKRFVEYATKRSVPDPEGVYEALSAKLTPDHSLLTRAVLACRLLGLAGDSKDLKSFLERIDRSRPHEYFAQFVDAIVEREVSKWVDRVGEPATPLLTLEEHHGLLAFLAEEMWMTGTEAVREDVLKYVADLFCESVAKGPAICRQVRERISGHALIVVAETGQGQYSFDHEEFKKFFLGEALARVVGSGRLAEIRNVLRVGSMPSETLDAAYEYLRANQRDIDGVLDVVSTLTRGPHVDEYTRENVGGLVARLLECSHERPVCIENALFSRDSLSNREICNARFCRCYFQPQALEGTEMRGCEFVGCEFERLELFENTVFKDVKITEGHVYAMGLIGHETYVYDPTAIEAILGQRGVRMSEKEIQLEAKAVIEAVDERVTITQRALRAFLRATHIPENVFEIKLGAERAGVFQREVLPVLLREDILGEGHWQGAGKRVCYRLNTPMHVLSEAFARCQGSFERWVDIVKHGAA